MDIEENKKTKGAIKSVVKNMRHKKDFVLFNKKIIRDKMKRIQSKLYKSRTYKVCKLFLPFFDDTRYILDEGINSLAYFCKDIFRK